MSCKERTRFGMREEADVHAQFRGKDRRRTRIKKKGNGKRPKMKGGKNDV